MVRFSLHSIRHLTTKSVKSVGKEKVLYDFAVTSIEDTPIDMSQFKDKVVLVANVATKCGYTGDNYKQMSELLNKYYDQGLRVLLFPCNQFNNQESGDSCAITSFASGYNPKFILTEKVKVNGSEAHPVFAWMKKKAGGFLIDAVKWNFTKFLIDRQGNVYPTRFAPNDEPNKMIPDIEKLLNKQ